MGITRAKFVCIEKILIDDLEKTGFVRLQAVTYGSEENQQFFKFTPSGDIRMNVLNPDAMANFEQGKEYYVDFTPAS